MAYAANTEVSSSRSLEQIKRVLISKGAKDIETAERQGAAAVQFVLAERKIRFVLQLPRIEEHAYVAIRGRRRARTSRQTMQAWEQATRSKWRALLACIKAKLISAESGIESLEEAFLANVVTSEGTTVWQDVVRRSADGRYLQAPGGAGLMLPAGDGAA